MDEAPTGSGRLRTGLWRPGQIYSASRRDRPSARPSEIARRQRVPACRRLRAGLHGRRRCEPRSPRAAFPIRWSASTANVVRRRSRASRLSCALTRRRLSLGIGGGKTADTAKVAACRTGARIVIVPTIASTDAPCSAVAVRYSTDGVYQEAISLPRNPDIVLVDSAVIVRAPARFLVAGIGDALSTWFEARSNVETSSQNFIAGGFPTPAAGLALARVCYDVLLRDALAAKHAAERGALTQAVENIIEANTLLSGLGFENCGVSGRPRDSRRPDCARRDARLLSRREGRLRNALPADARRASARGDRGDGAVLPFAWPPDRRWPT